MEHTCCLHPRCGDAKNTPCQGCPVGGWAAHRHRHTRSRPAGAHTAWGAWVSYGGCIQVAARPMQGRIPCCLLTCSQETEVPSRAGEEGSCVHGQRSGNCENARSECTANLRSCRRSREAAGSKMAPIRRAHLVGLNMRLHLLRLHLRCLHLLW